MPLKKMNHKKIHTALFILRRDFFRFLLGIGFFRPLYAFKFRKCQSFFKRHALYDSLKNGITKDQDIIKEGDKCYDMFTLNKLINKRKPQTILEFGCGLSTIMMAHSLKCLEHKYGGYGRKIHVVETSAEWASKVKACIPENLTQYIEFTISPATACLINHGLAFNHEILPDIIPDFIYLDGPDPNNVSGEINGISFKGKPAIAADILKYETLLSPGAMIMIDGRVPNAYFLESQFKYKYKKYWNRLFQYTTYELKTKWDFKP